MLHRQSERTPSYRLEILLISFAALLLEISYTRIISFKLYYYYTYLVIGLALLGIGSGAVLTAIVARLRRASTDDILQWGSVLGSVSVGVGYLIVARLPLRSMAIWNYGTTASIGNVVRLVILCFTLFASFVPVGVMIATLFARRPREIAGLYFADLLGAGLACLVVVPLLSSGGPPAAAFLSGVTLALVGLRLALFDRSRLVVPAMALVGLMGVGAVIPDLLPDVRVDDDKADLNEVASTRWSPVFRVDVAPFFETRQLLFHDGLAGSVILEWDGDPTTLAAFNFDQDPRSLPFDTLGEAPEKALIIGAAGGHEVLTALAYEVSRIDAVELNPATHALVTGRYAEFAGHFFDQPGVDYVTADGRSYLARSDDRYELIWYPAPDSYAASNVATSGAFVLSESYLYTREAVSETLDHLSAGGILAAQFGELNFDTRPNRTTRYVGTARDALEAAGIENPGEHVLVASTADSNFPTLRYSTVLVKATPFTAEEVQRFVQSSATKSGTRVEHVPGETFENSVSTVLTLDGDALEEYYDDYPYLVTPIDDDAPFFWHFVRFSDVIRDFGEPIHPSFVDPEDAVGERVLLMLLVIATGLASAFLLLPFIVLREVWQSLPRKGASATYFAALGLGFMFFEITLIQRFVLFLGYPTYSVTVTLASILIFTGVGALCSSRFAARTRSASVWLLIALMGLTVGYLFGLPVLTEALLSWPIGARAAVAFTALAPLGLCLGMFMPMGIGAVAPLSPHSREYVAWAWAMNGFASVVGAVLTTVLAMAFGFNVVLVLAAATYLIAVVVLRSLVPGRPTVEATAEQSPAVAQVGTA